MVAIYREDEITSGRGAVVATIGVAVCTREDHNRGIYGISYTRYWTRVELGLRFMFHNRESVRDYSQALKLVFYFLIVEYYIELSF